MTKNLRLIIFCALALIGLFLKFGSTGTLPNIFCPQIPDKADAMYIINVFGVPSTQFKGGVSEYPRGETYDELIASGAWGVNEWTYGVMGKKIVVGTNENGQVVFKQCLPS